MSQPGPQQHLDPWQRAAGHDARAVAPRRRNPVGVAALLVAIVLVLAGAGLQLGAIAATATVSPEVASLLAFAGPLVRIPLAIVAIGLGIVGVVLPERPRGAAAAGLGSGAAVLLGTLVGLVGVALAAALA